jgi:hypothetical protein
VKRRPAVPNAARESTSDADDALREPRVAGRSPRGSEGSPVRRRAPPREREQESTGAVSDVTDPPAEREASPSDYRHGPYFLLGYRYFGIYDWAGEGHTSALSIEGFPLARRISWLRVGLGLDVGFRRVDPHMDWTMRGFLTLGVQYPRRITPYVATSIGGGTIYRKRFGQGMTDGLFSFNVDAGATFKISRTFAADLSLGYMYSLFNDLQFNSVTVRVAIGW